MNVDDLRHFIHGLPVFHALHQGLDQQQTASIFRCALHAFFVILQMHRKSSKTDAMTGLERGLLSCIHVLSLSFDLVTDIPSLQVAR